MPLSSRRAVEHPTRKKGAQGYAELGIETVRIGYLIEFPVWTR